MIIKFFPEFFCYAIWIVDENGYSSNISANELPLSLELQKDIEDWESQYDGIFNENYPPNSRFVSKDDEIMFWNKGKELLARLRKELPLEYDIDLSSLD